jgi:peptidoglycan hydrolase CwlO-like protein
LWITMQVICMSELVKIVNDLEKKINRMILKVEDLKNKNQDLHSELSFYKERFGQTQEYINDLEKQIETLKTANALLGSDDFKRETKTRINSIVREID